MPQVKSKKSTGTSGRSATKNSTATASKNNSATANSARKAPAKSNQSAATGNDTMLEKFFVDSLKDIYWAEKHLTKALPKMSKAATNTELVSAFEEHLAVTEEQVSRLEEVFEMIGKKAQAKKCEAMEGLTKEAESIIEETEEGTSTRDVGLIMAAQKVEHYEIATYGGLVQLAKTLGMNDVADILAQTLEEEKETDANLTTIAENDINFQAEEEGEEDDEEAED